MALGSEVGFVAVPPQTAGASYWARMFYAFRPADSAPTSKPLFVIFNGGPGFATTSGLMAYGTGPMTLADGTPVDASPQRNAASYTRFANLLYVDERATGFSYPLRDADGGIPHFDCTFSSVGDAADFATVMLSFLDAHATLRDAPVVLMGESYGGTRAVAVMRILLHSGDPTLPIPDVLRAAVARHFGADGATPPSIEQVTRQFKGLVLLEPLVAGFLQVSAELENQSDPYVGPLVGNPHYDQYDLNKPGGWSQSLAARADRALADPSSSRGTMVQSCTDESSIYTQDRTPLDWFLDDLASMKLFLTHARWDGIDYMPAIPLVLQEVGIPTTVDTQPRPGYARPGWIDVMLPSRDGQPAQPIEIRYPSYENSGHMVATCQGADLADDVEQWLGALVGSAQ
jgi:hypothetical protein